MDTGGRALELRPGPAGEQGLPLLVVREAELESLRASVDPTMLERVQLLVVGDDGSEIAAPPLDVDLSEQRWAPLAGWLLRLAPAEQSNASLRHRPSLDDPYLRISQPGPDGVPIVTNAWLSLRDGEAFRIGRGRDNELVFEDEHVSRQHAIITVDGGELRLSDLKSRHGTLVNDRLLGDAATILRNGDRIVLGAVRMTVVIPGGDDSCADDVNTDQLLQPDRSLRLSTPHAAALPPSDRDGGGVPDARRATGLPAPGAAGMHPSTDAGAVFLGGSASPRRRALLLMGIAVVLTAGLAGFILAALRMLEQAPAVTVP